MHTTTTPDTVSIWVPVIVACVSSIPALAAFVYGAINHSKINQLSISINGRLTQLLDLTAKSSKAEGVAQEKKENAAL